MALEPHPLQPIRDGIEAVYSKAVTENNEVLHILALAVLVELDRLRRKAGISPISKGRKA
jgi:hypothetical protein